MRHAVFKPVSENGILGYNSEPVTPDTSTCPSPHDGPSDGPCDGPRDGPCDSPRDVPCDGPCDSPRDTLAPCSEAKTNKDASKPFAVIKFMIHDMSLSKETMVIDHSLAAASGVSIGKYITLLFKSQQFRDKYFADYDKFYMWNVELVDRELNAVQYQSPINQGDCFIASVCIGLIKKSSLSHN